MTRSAVAALLTVGLLASCGRSGAQVTPPPSLQPSPSAPAAPTRAPKPTRDAGAFDVDKALAHVRKLAEGIGIRETGSVGDVAAGDYLLSQIEKLGWQAHQQSFVLPKGGTSRNIIGVPPNFDERKPYLIVGGHYDSLRGPGANDNATGVGVSLEVARALAARPAALPVLYVGIGAEERESDARHSHHVGSRAYVAAMSETARRNLVAMVNVDMVGFGTYIHCPRLPSGKREGADRCVAIGHKLGIDARPEVQLNVSDHGTFLLANMNAAWVWAGNDKCCYHSPRDTMARVKRDEVDRAGRVTLALLRSYG